MSTDIRDRARKLIEEVWNNRKLSIVDELIDPSYLFHDPNTPELGNGPQAYKTRVELYTSTFPDLRFSIEDLIGEQDRVMLRWQATGTHKGKLQAISASGKAVGVPGMTILHAN